MATAILIILDGLGVGGAPDADVYGDLGSDTLGNMSRSVGGLNLPQLAALGLGNLANILGVAAVENPRAAYGRLQEVSAGKDSTTGHWELMGVVTEVAFPTYPDGFPATLLRRFTEHTGFGVLGNKAASGTDIIAELGDEHLATGKLIVYTSADSVFQIAAHEKVCDLETLYAVCEMTRELLQPPHNISRVIARPFTGKSGAFERTPYRHDYSLDPPQTMLLPGLQNQGVVVHAIGKIVDLYNGVGITHAQSALNNTEGMARLDALYSQKSDKDRLLMLNLVDFDMLWGHRNDPSGMKKGLEAFDHWLKSFLTQMQQHDLLLITADHGNDPTTPTTDHSREQVPILAYLAGYPGGQDIGIRQGFMDVGATIADFFSCSLPENGHSFFADLQ